MAVTLADVTVPAATWTNLYTATGLTVGVGLDIWNKGVGSAEIAISVAAPAANTGVPIFSGPLNNFLAVTAGEVGAWAYSVLGTKLSVQVA